MDAGPIPASRIGSDPIRQAAHQIETGTRGRGLVEITPQIVDWVSDQRMATGLLTLWCRHTSASLLVTENASPEVLDDIDDHFARLAPEDPRLYRHRLEGPDDMPAHLRAALTNVQLTIPVIGGAPALGTWQGIFLFEHRARPHRRKVVLHILGA